MRVPIEGQPADWFSWLSGADPLKSQTATLILGGLEPEDPVDPADLSEGLESSANDVVFWTVVGLGRLGAKAHAYLPRLAEIVEKHERFGLRQAAILAITRIAPGDPHTKYALMGALRDPSPFVRREAVQAFIKVRPLSSSDLEAISKLQQDSDEAVARWAGITLADIQRNTGFAV